MAHRPRFMAQLDRYLEEASRLDNAEDWVGFDRKWHDRENWPLRDRLRSMRPPTAELKRDGRNWSGSSWVYDLDAEARYYYFSVLLNAGYRTRFQQLQIPEARALKSSWMLVCPYCEMTTTESGEPHCPDCGRPLLAQHLED